MQASKNYGLFCKRKTNFHCHTLIFFMFIGSFTQICIGLLEAFSWYPSFFLTYPVTRQRILKISLSRIFSWCNVAMSKSHCFEIRATSNFLSVPFRVRDSGTRLQESLSRMDLTCLWRINFKFIGFVVPIPPPRRKSPLKKRDL